MRTVAALETAADVGRGVRPGQSVEYSSSNEKPSQDRVELIGEVEGFDAEYYAEPEKRV